MTGPDHWQMVGFVGQGIFTARFLVQWAASEKKRDSVIPTAFWWLSILGGLSLLAYSVHRCDPVFIVGQSMGLVVYGRNLALVARKKKREATAAVRASSVHPKHLPRAPHPSSLPEMVREEYQTHHDE